MSNPGAQSIDRAAQLVTAVVQADGPINFTELVEDCGLARSTTSRLLAALENNHLLERDQFGAYRAGALFALHAARHDPWSQLVRIARPVMDAVGAATGETVNLAIPRGDTVVQIAQVDSTYLLSARNWMQVDVPPHCSALGKVLYAFDALALPVGDLEQLTAKSLATSAALHRQLSGIRRRGYALCRDELEVGLDAVAAPVLGPDGDVVAGLGVSGPSARLTPKLDEIGALLVEHARHLSSVLRPRIRRKGVA